MWYKQAVFHQLSVRAFYDSRGDGHGDMRRVSAKLDCLKDLGVLAAIRFVGTDFPPGRLSATPRPPVRRRRPRS